MVNSSTAEPCEYCPCTSMPGETLRITTSPSICARSVYSWVTESALPRANSDAFFCARASSALAFCQLSSDAS